MPEPRTVAPSASITEQPRAPERLGRYQVTATLGAEVSHVGIALRGKYSWYSQNAETRSWPVENKKPNDLGLFDLHGNTRCWCQEGYKDFPQTKNDEAVEDKDDVVNILSTMNRVSRGGSFFIQAVNVRSAYRAKDLPSNRIGTVGIRPARTFTP